MLRLLVLLTLAVAIINGAIIPGYKRGLVPRLDGRIVGGVETTIEEFPYQVSLRYFGYHRCGGATIKSDVIISAAHCTFGIPPIYLVVVFGHTSHKEGLEHIIKKVINHETYDSWTYNNDISLIFLEKAMEFSAVSQPIDLASRGEKLRPGTMARVSGWGTLGSGGFLSDNLQYVGVTIVSNAECVEAYKSVNPVTEAMLCAGEPQGGRDACQGDSGGPVVVGNKLYGIVSWGEGCALPKYPGVNTDVGYLRDWIEENLKLN